MISAIIFTYWPEEENYIEACLKTVNWCDEIVVIDNGATQKALQKVRQFTDKIVRSSSTDFSVRHNLGAEKAKEDWLLFVDADERVSHALSEEIKKAVAGQKYAAYELERRNFFLGKEVKFGDRHPDYVVRLFRHDALVNWKGAIHESSVVNGEIGKLTAPLYHLTHRDIFSMMQKTVVFAEQEANLRIESNHPPVVGWRLVRVFLTEFFTRIIKYQGFRQGTEGWIDGIFQSFSLFIVYARLWELQRKRSLRETYERIDERILAEFSS